MVRSIIAALLLISTAQAEETFRDLVIEHERNVTVTVLTDKGCGTGFVVRMNCEVYVVTAQHVVNGSTKVQVVDIPFRAEDQAWGLVFDAEIIKGDETYDMALLKLSPETAAHFTEGVQFRDKKLRVGDRVHHIGAVRGIDRAESFSEGVVAFTGRIHPFHQKTTLDQVTCVIYPGSSGGPVFDEYGRVAGIALLSAGPQLGLIHSSELILDFLTR